MRILFDGLVYEFAPSGGNFLYFRELVPRIAAFPDTTVRILATGKGTWVPKTNGLAAEMARLPPAHWFPSGKTKDFLRGIKRKVEAGWLQWKSLGQREMLYHSSYYSLYPGKGIPQVFTILDLIDEIFTEYHDLPHNKKAREDKKRCIAVGKRFIAISEQSKKDLCAIYNVNPGLVDAIPLALDSSYQSAPLSPELWALFAAKYSLNKPYLLYVGGRLNHKNFPRALEAYASSSLKNQYQLVVAGIPWSPEETPLLKRWGVESHVTLIPCPDALHLRALYNHAKVFVYPSLYEGFGLPVLEAFAADVPVAAGNAGSIPEVGGNAALYFDPKDPSAIVSTVEKLLDPAEASRHRALGKERLHHFSWDKSAQQTMEAYRRTLES